jgi:hypothetical protein
MSVLWSKLMFEVLVRSDAPMVIACPLCDEVLATLPAGEPVMVGAIANIAHHQCPNVWDVLERHLLDNTGTLGFTRNGVPDPIPTQVSEEVAALPPGSYRAVTHNGKLHLAKED